MKHIQIHGGHLATVDDKDFEYLNKWKWQLSPRSRYVTRSKWLKDEDGKWTKHTSVYLHKEILSKCGFLTDHINGNRLDNRRANLRLATRSQNNYNAKTRKDNKLGHKGIVWREKSRDFVAYINVNGKRICLKTYHNLEDAITARRAAEKKYHGKFAYRRD